MIHELDESLRLKIEDSWEGRSGLLVEDAITRSVISEIDYDTETEMLYLKRLDGSVLETKVSAIEPSYIYGIVLYGIRLDGKVYNGSELLMQYRLGRKIELGIAIQSMADRAGSQSTVNKMFDVTIKFNNQSKQASIYPINHKYFKSEGTNLVLDIPEDENVEDIVTWVDVTNFFSKSFKEKTFEASFKLANSEGVTETFKNVLHTNITNEVIKLSYSGSIITNNNSIDLSYEPSSTNSNDYEIVGFIGEESFKLNKGDVTITGLKPGLNQISVQAININNSDVYTDWFNVDIIYTSADLEDTIVAINGVSNGITNNGVATLYEMTVYSPKLEEVEIITYLEDGEPGDIPNPKNIVKQEVLDPSIYNVETNSKKIIYKKYIEIDSNNASKYLVVKIDNEFYKFYSPYTIDNEYFLNAALFKEMKVEAINANYVYTKTPTPNFNFDLIGGYINNIFVTDAYATNSIPATIKSTIEASDGWHENEGRSYFKVSAQKDSIFVNPLNLGLNNNFTLELGLRTYNVSNIDKPILTLGKLQIRPTEVCWEVDRLASDTDETYKSKYLTRVSKFLEGVETHIVITLNSEWVVSKNDIYYPDYLGSNLTIFDNAAPSVKINLLRIYINGCIDREIKLEDSEVTLLKNSLLDINPTTSDVDFYLFRVYNSASLNFSEIIKNYISFIPNKTGEGSKEEIFNKNDIVGDDGTISWEMCLGKINTLLYIFPDGGKFPHRFWGGADGNANESVDKKKHTALFINYADPVINTRYGGRLNHLLVKGQGSSAMRYLIWNVSSSMKKHTDSEDNKINSIFTPMGLLYPESIPENYTAVESLKELKDYYNMPSYDGQVDTEASTYKYKKMVGKVNYASSMQSHKIGACKLYDDAYKTMKALPSGGLKAVHEEPFLYFYAETSLSDEEVSNLTWEQVLTLTDQIKFMGFQTWGPGKGDDACSGYDEDLTPEYLMLEGGENGDNSVNFLVPWHSLLRLTKEPGTTELTFKDLNNNPVINREQSEAAPWDKLLIDDESVVYRESGAWDIDYGCEEVEKNVEAGIMAGYFKFSDNVQNSLKVFREFYDFVYMTDFTFVYCDSTVTSVDFLNWDTNKKYLITALNFYINNQQVSGHLKYDMYRYDAVNETWVPAGLYYDPVTGKWDRLNITNSFYGKEFNVQTNQQAFRNYLKKLFTENIAQYVDTDDISFHQAFIKYLSGTDNRAKNTYFQIIGPVYRWIDEEAGTKELIEAISSYKIRLIGDDLDTILATDNNGLQSKAYNLIEDSYDSSYEKVWGDLGNIFFRMYDLCFEEDIRAKLKIIMNKAGLLPSAVNNKGTYFYKTFFKVLETFPEIAYNHTAKIYYENADVIKAVGLLPGSKYDFDYKHNNVTPIELSHGSSLECERQFMKERVAYLAGYALSCLDNTIKTSSGSGGGGVAMRLLLEFEPFLDFYPSYDYGTTVGNYKNFGELSKIESPTGSYESIQNNSVTRRYVAQKDGKYTKALIETSDAINQTLNLVNLYKSLSITGLILDDLEGNFERAVSFEIDNSKIEENPDIFGTEWPPLNVTNNAASLPVVLSLALKNMVLGDTLDLSTYHKLQTLDLTGSNTLEIVFPQTGNLNSVVIPSSVHTFRIYNNPGFTKDSVEFESLDNIETVYIDCAKCGLFDVANFCENLSGGALNSVTLRNINNISLTEETLRKILNCKTCVLEGIITIIDKVGDTTPKEISFETKQMLVNIFGNIDTGSNGLVIKYTRSNGAPSITYPESVDVYYDMNLGGVLEKGNPFNITIVGNTVNIIEGTNPVNNKLNYRLDIKYSLLTGNTSDLTIDPVTGNVTLKRKPSGATARITVNNTYYNTNGIILNFEWFAPQIGYFAYADGSFSKTYVASKKLLGIIYDKQGDADNGRLYILGTDITNTKEWVGYLTEEGYDSVSGPAIGVTAFIDGCRSKFNEFSIKIETSLHNLEGISKISKDSREALAELTAEITEDPHGYSDTKKYVDYVNDNILETIYKSIPDTQPYINTYSDGKEKYYIKNVSDLNKICAILEKQLLVGTSDYAYYRPSILFPYFYSAWLYNVESDYYTGEEGKGPKLQWYSPSVAEWAKIIYQYGYSAALEGFTKSNFMTVFNGTPSSEVNDNNYTDNFETTPIFALAKRKIASTNYPEHWNNLVTEVGDSPQLTTTSYDTASWGYVKLTEWPNDGSSSRDSARWKAGMYLQYTYESSDEGYGTTVYTLWGYYLRKGGLPFTTIPYSNPLKKA